MALRWTLAETEEGGTLFPDERKATRHVGKGAYAGLEFLQVNARSIINAVPPQSQMPFRYTINCYRGCSHACAYCIHGDTPILMGDGTTKPMAQVRAGDLVYGTVRRGVYRRYATTRVLDHWSTVLPDDARGRHATDHERGPPVPHRPRLEVRERYRLRRRAEAPPHGQQPDARYRALRGRAGPRP